MLLARFFLHLIILSDQRKGGLITAPRLEEVVRAVHLPRAENTPQHYLFRNEAA